jgi:hypothetical protein
MVSEINSTERGKQKLNYKGMILEFGPLLEIKYQFVYGPSITHYGDHFATKKKALKLDKQ